MVTVLTIGGNSVRRLLRDRSNIFFVFIFPLALVLLIGLAFGDQSLPRVAVAVEDDGALAAGLVDALEGSEVVEVMPSADSAAVSEAVSRGWAGAGVVVPSGYDESLLAGEEAEVTFVMALTADGPWLRTVVDEVVAEQAMLVRAARFVADEGLTSFDEGLDRAALVATGIPGVAVQFEQVGVEDEFALEMQGLGRFDFGASGQLLLFVFLITLAASAELIESRRLGVTHRMLATPTSTSQILGGQVLGRFSIAMFQGLYIMAGAWIIFGVNWGDPLAALVLLILFSLVSAGAAMVLGSIASNDAQAGGVGVFAGLAFAALGGSMMPLELLSPTMRRIAFATPHGWANDAFAEIVRRGGNVVDIAPQLGALASFAIVTLAAGTWLLHRALTRA